MPLSHGYSAASFEKNMRTLHAEGYPVKQSIAIAYNTARVALKKAKKRETKELHKKWQLAIRRALTGR